MKEFKGKDGKYHFIYRTHNLINGKEYTGKHSTDNLEDGYYGSGDGIKLAIKKYGIENFAVEILSFHDSKELALAEEECIITWEYVDREDTYNRDIGGSHGWPNRENRGLVKGKTSVKDKDGNTMQVSVDDPRYLSGELVGIAKGMVNVKDKDGKTMQVSKNDSRYLSGKLVGTAKGMVNVKDKDGNTMQVSVNDPNYLTREFVHVTLGGNKSRTNHVCPYCGKDGKGPNMKRYHFDNCKLNPNGNIREFKYRSRICPYCKKEGSGPNMTRYHFDNCKLSRVIP